MVGGGGDSLKTSDASRNVFNEVVIGQIAFRRRGLGGPRRTKGGGGMRGKGVSGKGGGSSGRGRGGRRGPRRGEKSGKDVVAIVDSGGEGGVLNFGGEKGRGSGRIRWKETDELESFGVGAVASNAIFFGDGFIDGGRDIE